MFTAWKAVAIATICSEYKTIYNLVLGEHSGDYLLSGLFGH